MPTVQQTTGSPKPSLISARPRFATPRRPERPTWGHRQAKIARLLGMPPMPWQREALEVAGEYDPETGVPFYHEVVLLVMRQQGKTTSELAATVDRFVSWPSRQWCVYSAQTGADARKKILKDWAPTIEQSPFGPMVKPRREGGRGGQVIKSNGHEAIEWAENGSFVETMASLEASGHGFSIQFGLVDEAWKDHDERREAALRPAMLTVPDSQLWVVSTAGNDDSTYLKRKVEAGREAAEADEGSGICYIEYSVPEEEDPFDLDVMLCYMPALCPTPGPCDCSDEWRHTVTHESLAAEQSGMDADEYRRAFGNQFVTGSLGSPIPGELWDQVQDPTASPTGRLQVALDVAEDRTSGAIAAAGDGMVELIDHRPGTGWMVEAAKALHGNWKAEIVIDGSGPAVPVADDLEDVGVSVTRMSNAGVVAACGRMYDAIADRKVKFRPSAEMDDAVHGLAKRTAGDRFMWSRTASSADITPFVAGTLAYSRQLEKVQPFVAFG